MKTVVFYEHADQPIEKFMEVFPRHQQVEDEFVAAGKVLGIGAFSVPGEGAMAIFRDEASAKDFTGRDPFVQEGLIAKVTFRQWDDELLQ